MRRLVREMAIHVDGWSVSSQRRDGGDPPNASSPRVQTLFDVKYAWGPQGVVSNISRMGQLRPASDKNGLDANEPVAESVGSDYTRYLGGSTRRVA